MIEVFLPENDDFSKNGDMVLTPSFCDAEVTLDDVWSLELEHPIDSYGRWKAIKEHGVLRVPSYNGEQLFRIRKINKRDSGIQAYARPIWMDAQNEIFLLDSRPVKRTGQQALNIILDAHPKYKGSSNITKQRTAYYILKNAAEAIMDADNSFIKKWGGEILFDNYRIIINDKVGTDNGLEIRYGKNLPADGLVETVSVDGVVTRIIPQGYNGRIIRADKYWFDSPIINKYPIVRSKLIEYPEICYIDDIDPDDEDLNNKIICTTLTEFNRQLRIAAENDFNKNNIDKPEVTIKCNMVLLQNTEEYKNYKQLEVIGLGDTVYCHHEKLGITATTRIESIVWDCIGNKPKSIEMNGRYNTKKE